MSIKVEVKKISAHFIWIMGVLEAITVPLVVAIPAWTGTALKNPLHGIIVGFSGTVILFYCINQLLAKLNINLMKDKIVNISVFPSAFWSGLILALIFVIQNTFKLLIPFVYPVKEIVLGFISAGGSILLCGLIYQISIPFLPMLGINIRTSAGLFQIRKLSLWRFSLLSGVYESIALPIILLWNCFPHYQFLIAAITGMMGGIAGGAFIWIISMMPNMIICIILKKATI